MRRGQSVGRDGGAVVSVEHWWRLVWRHSAQAVAQAELWGVGGALVLAFFLYLGVNILAQMIRRLISAVHER
jgi:hypothetical protein